MKNIPYKSVFELEGKELTSFIDKYGDVFYPRYVDLDYYKAYYLGKYDPTIMIFNYLAKTYDIKKVVYPGSFIHIAPSFSFNDVTYIDMYDNIDSFYENEDIFKYIDLHKSYTSATVMNFIHSSYNLHEGKYDLLISSNAGSVSVDCKKLLNKTGYLLVNNGHSDADNAFSDNDYDYLGYFRFKGDKDYVSFIVDGTSKKDDTYYLFKLRKG